jgi:RNA polymerase sigma-70 factor (ECF subfamily)
MNSSENEIEKIEIVLTKAHKEYAGELKKRAFFKLSDRMLVQDIVQDTFLKTWKYLRKGGRIETMRAFLYRVLNDLIVDEYRKRKAVSLDMLIEKGFEPRSDDVSRLIDQIDGKIVLFLIGRLPAKYQKIMLMRYIEDLSLNEISQKNGQTKNTNAVQIHRAIEMVRSLSEGKLN